MFPAWRLQLREARRAVADGRWEEAAELLAGPSLREFLPAKRLSRDLAAKLTQRARQRLDSGDSTAGWRDFDRAVRLGAAESEIAALRTNQAGRQLAHACELLARGEAAAARQILQQMHDRRLSGPQQAAWLAIAEHVSAADMHARKGNGALAIESLEHARGLAPPDAPAALVHFLTDRTSQLRETLAQQHTLDARLHAALAAANWTEVLTVADGLLELAPLHSAALQARQKAWQAVGMDVTLAHYPSGAARARQWKSPRPPFQAGRSTHHVQAAKIDTVSERSNAKRIVAWIDAVGAFLICLGDEVVLGQPSPEGGVDVPILGDLSRRHAVIRRDREAYVLTPLHRVAIDGRPIAEPTVLRDKSVIKLGDSVELTFRKPHALSATAVLELTTRHRTEPAVDGIVLMSESCIFGSQPHSHVRCRDWTGDLVLFRRNDQLLCRTQSPLEVDGQTCIGQTALTPNCRIQCDEFALSLEEI